MSSFIKKQWHWQLIKLIVKQSMEYYKEAPFIRQEMIENIQKQPYKIKEILRKGNKAQTNLNQAVNQFNLVVELQEVDASIIWWTQCEQEVERALNEANRQLKEILWEKPPSD